MIFLERIKSKVTMAIMLKDDLTPEKQVIGAVFLKIPGINKPPVRHATGYFLLLDMPEGKNNIIVGGSLYKEQGFIVDTKPLNPKQPTVDLSLNPDANYPFPAGITILKGKIIDVNNKPIPGALIKIKEMPENAVSGDDGRFFIRLDIITSDKNITLNVKKSGFKAKGVKLLLKKGVITSLEINLIK